MGVTSNYFGQSKKKKRTGGVTSKYFSGSSQKNTLDLQTLAGAAGVTPPPEKPKLSILGRLGAGLSALETGNAVFTGMEKGVGAGIKSYFGGVAKGIGAAITGNDYDQTGKKGYKDVVERMGVENGIAKFGLGFAGDVLLDPSTYFGGAIAKGGVKAAKAGTKLALKGVGKFAPEAEKGLKMVGQGLKDAAGKAFVYGYGTSKGLPEKALTMKTKLDDATVGIVKSNVKRIGTGTLSESQMDELATKMLEGKRAEFMAGKGTDAGVAAAKAALQTSDPLVKKTIELQIGRTQKFAKAAGINDPYSVYFPGIKKDKIEQFFTSTRSLRVGSEGYKKEFQNLLKNEEMVLNPAEAFAKREVEIVKDTIIRDQLHSMVKEFGKKLSDFASEEEALKAGYKLVKEKGMFGKAIGYLKDSDKAFIDNLIPRTGADTFAAIDAIAKHTGFDAITSLFKRSVTGLFAPFHVRNYVSGAIQNYEVLGPKALSPLNVAAGHKIALGLAKGKSFGDDLIDLGGRQIPLNKIAKPFADRFGTSSQYIADIADATATKPLTKITSLNPLSAEAVHFRAARAVGNFIETQQKATAYVTALRSGSSVKEALDLATRAGFDYRALTPFESKVLRRIIPFYSFTRKNVELQLRTLGENPQRIANIMKLVRDAGNLSAEEREGLPDYAKEQFSLKLGTSPGGLPEIAVGLGSPIEQIGQLFGKNPIQRMAATMNPIFKVPLERAFGKDFFRDRPLNEVVEANEYAKFPQFIKDFLQVKEITETKKDGTTKTVYKANPYRLQLLRNLPTTRGASYVSAAFDERSATSKVLSSLTGVKPKPVDIETVEYFRERDRQKELEELLIQAGVLKRFEKVYQPKNQQVRN